MSVNVNFPVFELMGSTRYFGALLDLRVTSAPAVSAIPSATVKEWLRIDSGDTSNDAVIALATAAAVEAVEKYTNRALITQTRRATYGKGMQFKMIGEPIQSVTTVEQINEDGTFTALVSGTDYDLFLDTATINCKSYLLYGVRVTYVCGYGVADTNVPATAKQAIERYIATNYEIREDGVMSAVSTSTAPTTWEKTAQPLKIYSI